MTEIKIIESVAPQLSIDKLSADERHIIFERMADENKQLPRSYFEDFEENTSSIISYDNMLIVPTIRELLFRKIIELGKSFPRGATIPYVTIMPLIASKRVAATFGSADVGRKRRFFTDIEVKKPKIPIDDSAVMRIVFDVPTYCKTIDNNIYVAPPGEIIEALGFVFVQICKHAYIPSPQNTQSHQVHLIDQLILGSYTFQNIADTCHTLLHPNYDIRQQDKVVFKTNGDGDIGKLFKYFVKFIKYYGDISTAHFLNAQLITLPALSIQRVNKRKLIAEVIAPPCDKLGEKLSLSAKYLRNATLICNGMRLLLDLNSCGLLPTYYHALISGLNSPIVESKLNAVKLIKSRRDFESSIAKKQVMLRYKISVYLFIIEKKLGQKQFDIVYKEYMLHPYLQLEQLLTLLPAASKKIVEIEYIARTKYMADLIGNKCPHVPLAKKFRLSNNRDDAFKLYKELTAFFKENAATTVAATAGKEKVATSIKDIDTSAFIKCNNCSFPIICPHIRTQTELEATHASFAIIQTALAEYVDRAPVYNNYYCKICGEIISTTELYGSVSDEKYATVPDELYSVMWGEVASAMRSVMFTRVVNVPTIIKQIIQVCASYIIEVEKQLLKSKTGDAEDTNNKLRLFITLYAYAYLIVLITSNSGINFVNMKPSKQLADYVRHALVTIINTKNVIIRGIKNINNDFIKNKLIDAYKAISQEGKQIIYEENASESIFNNLMLDPVYKYLYIINTIGHATANKYEHVDSLDNILGMKLDGKVKPGDIFANVRVPNFTTSPWNCSKIPSYLWTDKEGYTQAIKCYISESFKSFHDKIQSDILTASVYTQDSFLTPLFKAQKEKYAKLRELEVEVLRGKAAQYSKGVFSYKYKDIHDRTYVHENVPLSRHYDEKGRRHIFNIFIMGDKESTNSELNKRLLNGERVGVATNTKCSVCGILKSATDTLDDSKIRDALNAESRIKTFFKFYELLCPVEGNHEYDKDKCKKCGISKQLFSQLSSTDALAYYALYKDQYEANKHLINYNVAAAYTTTTSNIQVYPEYVHWAPNYNIILTFANKMKINPVMITSIGATEGVPYADILSGKYKPEVSLDAGRDNTRLYHIDSWINLLINEYNGIRYYNNTLRHNDVHKSLVETSGTSPSALSSLKPIYDDYYNRFMSFIYTKTPGEAVTFAIETLIQKCQNILNDGDSATANIRLAFVTYFIKKVVRTEELLSKPNKVNWNIFKIAEEKEQYDENLDENAGAATSEELKTEGLEDTGKLFADHFDMENDEVAEDNDPDMEQDVGDT